MYTYNKYFVWYFSIIEKAKLRVTDQYTESHHIIPKSLSGTDDPDNLVKLLPREHFICHWLLIKITEGENQQKMKYALWMMMHATNEYQERYRLNSHSYAVLKENLSKVFSVQHKGKKMSEETKRKISETRKRKIADGELVVNVNKEKYKVIAEKRRGKKHSEETKSKIGKAHKGKTISEEQKKYLSELNTGNVRSEETKRKISEGLKRSYADGSKVSWNKGRKGIKHEES